MNIKVPSWLAYKLTGLSKKYRITDCFKVIKETEKAYQVAYLRDESPLGWVAKSLVLEMVEDDSAEWSKVQKHFEKVHEENQKYLEKLEADLQKALEERKSNFEKWLEDHEYVINNIKSLENENTWIAASASDLRDHLMFSCGFSNIDSLIKELKTLIDANYRIKISSIRVTLKHKDSEGNISILEDF